jgi:DNA-binding transcriptional MerR regulator
MSRAQPPTPAAPRLLRINEVAAETGLTTRAIRYYEEIGLLEPAARSDGDYRLYDASDLDRLAFIRSLRDDAGFSLAQIGQLLEDGQPASATANDFGDRPTERHESSSTPWRVDGQIETLRHRADRKPGR